MNLDERKCPSCGASPRFDACTVSDIMTVRVVCKCGMKTPFLYTYSDAWEAWIEVCENEIKSKAEKHRQATIRFSHIDEIIPANGLRMSNTTDKDGE